MMACAVGHTRLHGRGECGVAAGLARAVCGAVATGVLGCRDFGGSALSRAFGVFCRTHLEFFEWQCLFFCNKEQR
ncbi:hypothetical protein STCU_10516 [Strigomonas culicis]|uniref:Uncharacterized protein n=1 Tax=Strigomonas culicis TaxID=28005 RepID=S9TLF0_9TRYP|nr:hypothetical protein STCU_10516 [Strigomonas culicis]|eukprot:EPY17619.1 hypothetical protein STCU_10516 [Strigomonas culicis]